MLIVNRIMQVYQRNRYIGDFVRGNLDSENGKSDLSFVAVIVPIDVAMVMTFCFIDFCQTLP